MEARQENDDIASQVDNSPQHITSQASEEDEDVVRKVIIYNPETETQPLEEWLEANRPSALSTEDGAWEIIVKSPYDTDVDEIDVDLDAVNIAWHDLSTSGTIITHNCMKTLALKYNFLSGKWYFLVPIGYKADLMWKRVAINLVQKSLGKTAYSALVLPLRENHNQLFYLRNHNFTNADEVVALERAIRATGIKCRMSYKPDMYTYCGIIGRNSWNLCPYIYRSTYDVRSCTSEIKPEIGN